jgi:hypothetical protein
MHFFGFFVIPNFFIKKKMSNNQVEGEIIEQTKKWDDHTIMIWVYEGVMSYISQAKKKANMLWIFFDCRKIYCTRTYH